MQHSRIQSARLINQFAVKLLLFVTSVESCNELLLKRLLDSQIEVFTSDIRALLLRHLVVVQCSFGNPVLALVKGVTIVIGVSTPDI